MYIQIRVADAMICVKSFQPATMRASTGLSLRLNRNCRAEIGKNMSHFHVIGSRGGTVSISANMVMYVVTCRSISRTLIAMGSVIRGKLKALTNARLPEIALEPATTVLTVNLYINTPISR